MSASLRRLKNLRYRVFYRVLTRRASLLTLGDQQSLCAWTFCPDCLNNKSVVYTGGVGRNISFEHALVKRFGCDVVLFDPSPTGLETMSLEENKIPQFKFCPVGLAGSCGKLTFAPPLSAEDGSWFARPDAKEAIEVPCVDLSTLMRQNGHERIDLLKIDIEGSEYEVLDDVLKRHLPVRQVLVEFHHHYLPHIRRDKTIRAILKMVAAGYRLLNQENQNHTFLNPSI